MGWTVEQAAALAPSPAQFAAADEVAEARRWTGAGSIDDALWGRYVATSAEPYDTAVDVGAARHGDGEPRWRCTCPSRKRPCKHALGLLLLWIRGQVPAATPASVPATVRSWVERPAASASGGDEASVREAEQSSDEEDGPGAGGPGRPPGTAGAGDAPDGGSAPGPEPGDRSGRDDRVARMRTGLVELSRWLEDRARTGLSDPALARYDTWDELAARLVDAQVGALANRVRRVAAMVGAFPGWHEAVLGELGILHVLARAGRHLHQLPVDLGDGVATAVGWQVRHATVLAGVPDTDVWDVSGRSDTREDRIVVRRTWLRGRTSGRWAMVLSFAAYQQALDTSLPVGAAVPADVHRFPGSGMRALVGRRYGDDELPAELVEARDRTAPGYLAPSVGGVGAAVAEIGHAVLREPWSEHAAVTLRAAATIDHGRWVLTDDEGSVACVASDRAMAGLLAATRGAPATLTAEWTPAGFMPVAVHLADRTIDIGPRADPDFVSAP